MPAKTCRTCLVEKPVSDFDAVRKGRYGVLGTCKACNKAKRLAVGASVNLAEKPCPRCGAVKAISEFNRSKYMRDGRQVYCRPCGRALSRARANTITRTEKRCPGCETTRPVVEFCRSTREADGLQRYCRECNLRDRYGLSVTQYRAMFAVQGGKCAICRRPGDSFESARRMAVDHDHETGAVRALLCGRCNSGLGFFGDDPERLFAAAAYLEAHHLRRVEAV